MNFKLKDNFLMGTASAAAQIEGGRLNNNWNDWYLKGLIHDGSDPAVADDHWNRWREDIDLMAEMKLQIARFGVEWARIMPEEGVTDRSVIARYREEIEYMREKGIMPLMTIHHFSNPMWFENKGGFTKRKNLHYFMEFTQLCADSFGDLVSEYITINEPNVYATNCYMFGLFPPAHESWRECFLVLENMAHCHIEAYRIIHETREKMGYTDTKVGIANHLRSFDPKCRFNPGDIACAKAAAWGFQGAITQAMSRGNFIFPLRDHWHTALGEYCDFNGINYYSRSTVSGLKDGVRKNSPRNDLDWEIYPQGMIETAEWVNRIISRPIYITENGTCDNTDSFRAKYLYEQLKAISESDLPFERYYHWCFTDNFEWLEGESARFGLVHVDYRTQERTVKKSGRFFTEIIENGGVTNKMYADYVRDEEYNIR